ncbi:Tripartite tricarboxylate transporter family receptor [Pigmentiphaga humi]|uniref:Tripartite tricarboxylate transporter family receptor n=1 Tax=Pigmentiphaga humi TaxID=2478468 RepID=A0A3P4AZW1_9BURK|nr:tripartite tricarboxylate transporter substrate binding protein [Pigmentiphaga humi]VCU68385.1 Tripartite tricarboxylate transporter family receptor [Pigmentiphaga humi]
MIRTRLLKSGIALWAAMCAVPSVHAQAAYPNRPVTLVVQSVPGAITDQMARLYGERMARVLGQPVLIENMGGAGGLLAFRRVARAEPDGYTLLVTVNTVLAQPHLSAKAGYAMKDFSAVGEMGRSSSLLVTSANSPYKSLADLIEAARKSPGTVSYGSSGIGTTNHLNVEMLASRARVKFLHVPYKGVAAAVPDVAGGRLDFVMPTASSTTELLNAGMLLALAISSAERSPRYPDVPTLAELGYPDSGFEIWCGVLGPARLPPDVIKRLEAAMEAARGDKDLVQVLAGAGQHISPVRTAGQFEAVLKDEDVKLQDLIKRANITID